MFSFQLQMNSHLFRRVLGQSSQTSREDDHKPGHGQRQTRSAWYVQ